MKKLFLLSCFSFFVFDAVFGQDGTWTWISGDSALNSPGVFGTQGVPSVNNHPPALYEAADWKDKQGNFWLYGGQPNYSDLWKYDPITNEWTWVKGNGLQNQKPFYGIKGVPNSLNNPGERNWASATWVDTSGSLWLFGGNADSVNTECYDDLWKYDVGANQWIWITGDSFFNAGGAHGNQGIPSASNHPGARMETASAWTDSLNNLWLYGGLGFDETGTFGFLGDLNKYNINTNEWTWMKGAAQRDAQAKYGIKGVADTNNDPGSRFTYTKWKDLQGNFWMMGGYIGKPSIYIYGYYNYYLLNDLWKYDNRINQWTWMSGTNALNDPGNYLLNCILDTIDVPRSRFEQRSSVTDNCGRFWLMAGANNVSGSNCLNDLWMFDPQQLKWNWVSGSNVSNQTGNYGVLGLTSPANIVSPRFGAVAWWKNDNKYYLFGGYNQSGSYYSDLWVFNPDTSCVTSCNSFISFQSDKTTLCANDCVNFTSFSTDATAWQWSFAGGSPSSSTNQNPQVCYLTSGIYNVALVASNAAGSDTLSINNYITVDVAPAPPNILDHPGIGNDTLFFLTQSGYISWQWYSDSALIANATDTFIVVSQSGNYNVVITGSNGCKISAGINVIIGLQNYVNDNMISLFPNPATDELFISGNWQSGTGKLSVVNVLGETIYSKELNSKQETVNCKHFASGIYFVQVVNESGRWIGRFVKE